MARHRVEGCDRLIRGFGAGEDQVSDPLDLTTEFIQPLPAYGRGHQFRSQIHGMKYLVGADRPSTTFHQSRIERDGRRLTVMGEQVRVDSPSAQPRLSEVRSTVLLWQPESI
ncbi:hypothetical protein [Streptomyces sp. NPDC056165]|uniref:hypothetical protein n=1 Tax=Streptomyces sp. NPDC056165 TaxID=3345733 RepID=UPI0035DEB4CF